MEVRSWSQFVDAILLRKVSFLVAFFVVFLLTYALLATLDFLPELVTKPAQEGETEVITPVTVTSVPLASISSSSEVSPVDGYIAPVYPLSITIEPLGKTISVLNPTSRKVSDLDAALLEGVVRHPDSATLEQNGTVFILGHSSYLPVVRNKNFQALNGIQDLKWGDTITISSTNGEYVYRVDKVYRAKAGDVVVPIAGPTQRLYLATCNSFGSQDDRYIVEADLVEVVPF
jgi:LPXTG-site transpeptidase (sortase) family protein